MGINSSSTVKSLNNSNTTQIGLGLNIIQKLENNWLVNANINFIIQTNRYNGYNPYGYDLYSNSFLPITEDYLYYNYNRERLTLNFPLKIGYEFDVYGYGIIPKFGIYASNPINYLDFDYGSVYELEFNKKLKKVEFFSLMNYQLSSKKEKYYFNSDEIRTSNYALNIQFGLNLLLGKG